MGRTKSLCRIHVLCLPEILAVAHKKARLCKPEFVGSETELMLPGTQWYVKSLPVGLFFKIVPKWS